ncbi:MAG: hypothetical protein ACTHU0_34755 [Kofleriaceae bacterium]
MLASLSGALRCALALSLTAGYVLSHTGTAYADDEEEEEDDGGGGGGDGEEGEDGEEEDKDQPPVTAGGLFTLKTYPVRELFRPLTLTQGITQLRASLGVDVSDKTAFEYAGISLDGRYGWKDNFTVIGGFAGDYNFNAFDVYAGFEGALAYDLFDIKAAVHFQRAATVSRLDLGPDTTMTGKPTHYTQGAGSQFSFDIGFPFRYVARPEIAIIALDTLISFDFNAVKRGNNPTDIPCLAVNNTALEIDGTGRPTNCVEDGIKPDLNPSIGIATNPVAMLDVRIFVQLQIRDFDTTNQFVVPATARVQFTPSQKLDIGLEFKFLDVVPKDPDGEKGPAEAGKFYDNRFMNMFVQARF